MNSSVVGVFSKSYRKRQFEDEVLRLGNVSWSRQQMYDLLHNGHTVAAKTVSDTLKRMGVTTAAGIRKIPATDWARVEGFGEAALRILLDILLSNYDYESVNDWLTANLKGNKLVQWDAICAQAVRKSRKRGKHAA